MFEQHGDFAIQGNQEGVYVVMRKDSTGVWRVVSGPHPTRRDALEVMLDFMSEATRASLGK
jgi:hypothetical protein